MPAATGEWRRPGTTPQPRSLLLLHGELHLSLGFGREATTLIFFLGAFLSLVYLGPDDNHVHSLTAAASDLRDVTQEAFLSAGYCVLSRTTL